MTSLLTIVLTGILIAFIATAVIFIIKNITTPSRLDGIPRMLKERKYLAAQKTAKAIIAKNPRNYLAHYYLGKAYLGDSKNELAFMEYKTVNENALFNGEIPEVEFRKQMADLYKKFNQKNDALREYLLLTKLEPHIPAHNFNAAEIYEEQGNTKLAAGFYQKTIMADQKNGKAYTALGRILSKTKNTKQAKQALQTAIKLNPDNYENYYYLGKIAKEEKDLPGAVKLLEKAERSPVVKQKALLEKGSCLMLAGQNDKAMDSFVRSIDCAKDPRSQETLYARYFLGICYEKNRKIEKAIEEWEIVFKVNSKFKDVASKLSQYKELETNDGIKEYLTSNNQQFIELCKKIIHAGFNLECQKAETTPFGCQMLATEGKNDSWMNAKAQVYLLYFYRSTDVIEDGTVRKLADAVKSKNYIKGMIFASSDFAPQAFAFAENRPIVLVPKNQLEALFKKAGL